MEKDINESIKKLDFEALVSIMEKLKFASRSKIYYQKSLELLEDIKSNEKIREIISTQFIPVEIKFEYDNNDNSYFKIEESKFKEKDKDIQIFIKNKRMQENKTKKKKLHPFHTKHVSCIDKKKLSDNIRGLPEEQLKGILNLIDIF